MRALTLTQPWATLVAVGAKEWETRSWNSKYRGPLAIHAAKGFPPECRRLAETNRWIAAALRARDLRVDELPLGAVIAVGRLTYTAPTHEVVASLTDAEVAFGDYTPGRYAWRITDVEPLTRLVPARGSLFLWEWDEGATT